MLSLSKSQTAWSNLGDLKLKGTRGFRATEMVWRTEPVHINCDQMPEVGGSGSQPWHD